MTGNSDLPLVTIVVMAYNQDAYVSEAVQAALAQTYPSLQVILSDDCSPDGTFAKMQAAAAAYTGPHAVMLNRNERNLGIGSHVNVLLEMAAGELIVLAAGDDISEPDRVASIVEFWLDHDRRYDAIWSKATVIDAQGRPTGALEGAVSHAPLHEQVKEMIPCLVGCSHATTKRLFQRFGPLPGNVVFEDKCLGFRALLSGGFGYIDRPLVRYRIHPDSVSNAWRFSRNVRVAWRLLQSHRVELARRKAALESFRRDLALVGDEVLDPGERARTQQTITHMLAENETETLIAASGISDRLNGFLRGFFVARIPLARRARYLVMLLSPRAGYVAMALARK